MRISSVFARENHRIFRKPFAVPNDANVLFVSPTPVFLFVVRVGLIRLRNWIRSGGGVDPRARGAKAFSAPRPKLEQM
jgi:hypothetical protein